MKVVLLAGGLGTRMREETEFRPKPMVEVGGKPVLWHIMKIFAAHGHTDFIICAGYKGEQIKNYFYNYAAMNLDFTLTLGDNDSATFHGSHDEFDWRVTVADTGQITPTGGRIKRVERFIDGDDFFCTYGDGIADVDISALLSTHRSHQSLGTVTVTNAPSRFGVPKVGSSGEVLSFREKPETSDPVSIGFFVFNNAILGRINDTSILETEVLVNLVGDGNLQTYRHQGFWQPMDTLRELSHLNDLWTGNEAPWKIWG